MCLIDVSNLKEIEPWEGYFYSKILQKWCKGEEGEEKCEENWPIFESVAISCTPLT